MFWSGVVVCVIIFFGIMGRISKYKKEFVYTILKPVLEKNNLKYYPSKGFSEEEALASGLFDFSYDDYFSDNMVVGDKFVLSYVKFVEEKEEKDDEGNTTTYEVTKFGGFLIIIKMKKEVKAFVEVKPSSFHLSDVLPVTYDKRRVKLDNPEFEKYFDVYSDDQIEARYLLDHVLMEKLLYLRKKIKLQYINFFLDKAFNAVEYDDFTDKIPLFRKVDEKTINDILLPVTYAEYLSDFLNNDERIENER
jgi:hypothetical protein